MNEQGIGMLHARRAVGSDVEFLATASLSANEERLSAQEDWDADQFTNQAVVSARNEVKQFVIRRLRVRTPSHHLFVLHNFVLPEKHS